MIDKLSLTIYEPVDFKYLEEIGELRVDEYRKFFYKNMFILENEVVVFCDPHKYSPETNMSAPQTKIDLNPKYFTSFNNMTYFIRSLMSNKDLSLHWFNVSRIDVKADIPDTPVENILTLLHVKRVQGKSLSFFKGTIYIGSNPKFRIYNKNDEILSRVKKGWQITDYEKGILASGKVYTRFEVQIRTVKKNLEEISEDPFSFEEYFDRLEFFNFKDNDGSGILQYLYRHINRKFRNELEVLRDFDLTEAIKDDYRTSVTEWFQLGEPF